MAVTHVQTRSGQSTGASVSVSITTTAGNLLGITTGRFGAAAGAPSRTGETNSVALADANDGAATEHIRGDYMMNIGGNSNAVTGNGGGGTACDVTEMTGAATTGALGALVTSNSSVTTTVLPGAITPTAGSLLMTGVAGNNAGSGASTINTGGQTGNFTVDEAGGALTVWDNNSAVCGSAHHDNCTATSTNPTWTTGWTGTTRMVALMMEFLAAGGGGAVVTPLGFKTLLGIGQ